MSGNNTTPINPAAPNTNIDERFQKLEEELNKLKAQAEAAPEPTEGWSTTALVIGVGVGVGAGVGVGYGLGKRSERKLQIARDPSA